MSWLYSIVFAGLLFSADGNLPLAENNGHTESATTAAAPDETEKFERNYPLNANGRISVSNVNGSITIETWDKPEIKLEWIKTADVKESLNEVEIKIDARKESFSVETRYLDWKRPNANGRVYSKLTVEYRLTVPRGAVLDEIETVNGSVSIANAENTTKASAVNGEVRAINLRGTAHLSTVNGVVTADFDQLPSGSRITLETVNGSVNLTLPSDANATLKAETLNGKITNDFGLPVRKGEYVGRDLYGKIGGGDVPIRLNSVNGGLSVNRKNDGKTANPATNLLNLKSDDDEDRMDDDDEGVSGSAPPAPPRPPKSPKPLPRTPAPPLPPPISEIDEAEIRRSVEDAMREANREIAAMKPELGKINAEAIAKAAAAINSEDMQRQIREMQTRYAEGGWTTGAPLIEKKNGSFPVKGTPKVTVEAKDCQVTVRGWDKPEVSYSVVRIARSNGKSIDAQWTTSATKTGDSEVNIKISSAARAGGAAIDDGATQTRLEIFVPRKSDLKVATRGEIRLEGVSGEIDLQGADEAVNVRDAAGKLTVATTDGRIRLIGFRGAFQGSTTDGLMNLEGDFQSFNATATDGTIILTLPADADADLESNIEIENDGAKLVRADAKTKSWRVGKGGKIYRMDVQDGRVIVRNAGGIAVN